MKRQVPDKSGHGLLLTLPQNLRDEVAMDVDEDEESAYRPKRVPDFGIEVDFDKLNEDERSAVRFFCFGMARLADMDP